MSGLVTRLKGAYAQINFNRVTLAFFLFSFVHCCAQGLIQSLLFSLDSQFSGVVTGIVQAAAIPPENMTFIQGSSGSYTLRMCNDIPYARTPSPCMVIFQSSIDVDGLNETSASESLAIVRDLTDGFSISPAHDSSGVISGVNLETQTDSVFLSEQCAQILVFPRQELDNGIREDVASVFLQFWLFGVSAFAVSQSSIPHLLTAFGTRFLVTAWSAYIVAFRTNDRRTKFSQVISAPGTPCGVNLFPTYFEMHMAYDIADLILSSTALVLSAVLSWKLLKMYSAQSFNRVGAPAHITRIYKFFMAIKACLQLEVFVLMSATGLWIDVLANTSMRFISDHTVVYYALVISTSILVIPWLVLGWYGVKEESPRMMMLFLAIALYFIAGWSVMFDSHVYTWSFVQWPFLGCYTVASFILIIASVVLGSICWRNFGKGLAQYLHAEAALEKLGFASGVFDHQEDVEKSGDLYTYDDPVPDLKSTFQSTEAWPVTNAVRMQGPARGPGPIYQKPYNGLV